MKMKDPNNAKKANAEALDIDNETIAHNDKSGIPKAAILPERFTDLIAGDANGHNNGQCNCEPDAACLDTPPDYGGAA